MVDNRLKFNDHISRITAKTRQITGLLFRCFITRDAAVLTKAFLTYVTPLLEYASPVWNPVAVGLVDKVESVQRQLTIRIPGLEKLPYSQRQTILGLESLEMRRLKADLILAYKIIAGITDVNPHDMFTLRENSFTRGIPKKSQWITAPLIAASTCSVTG